MNSEWSVHILRAYMETCKAGRCPVVISEEAASSRPNTWSVPFCMAISAWAAITSAENHSLQKQHTLLPVHLCAKAVVAVWASNRRAFCEVKPMKQIFRGTTGVASCTNHGFFFFRIFVHSKVCGASWTLLWRWGMRISSDSDRWRGTRAYGHVLWQRTLQRRAAAGLYTSRSMLQHCPIEL